MEKKELIKFEDEIADLYKQGKIRSPIHLAGTNEDELIEIFKDYKDGDWIFSTWRSHYHWLLSGRSPEELKRQIIEGHSMHIFAERFFTSAIVGGTPSIAVGIAYALKKEGSKNKVWCFLGDMGAAAGITWESMKYACRNKLPVNFIIEDNGLSVKTDTQESWGNLCGGCAKCKVFPVNTRCYAYKRKYPHAGCGVFVLF